MVIQEPYLANILSVPCHIPKQEFHQTRAEPFGKVLSKTITVLKSKNVCQQTVNMKPTKNKLHSFFDSEPYSEIPVMHFFIEENSSVAQQLATDMVYDFKKIYNYFQNKTDKSLTHYFIAHNATTKNGKPYIAKCLIPLSKNLFVYIYLESAYLEYIDPEEINKEDYNKVKCVFYYSRDCENIVEKYKNDIQRYRVKPKTTCNIIASNLQGGLYLEEFGIKAPEFDIHLNYGKELVIKDKILKKRLIQKDGNGIALLYGNPGTGKTTYIRYLINKFQKEKSMIYVPPSLINEISSPHFISFMMSHSNSILIIEDAEDILSSRENKPNLGVHNLLNISDGLLGEAINVQIICTFNTTLSKIDNALKRKGRIIIEHEFSTIDKESAQKLSDSLGFHAKIERPMTLAEIYNQDEMDFSNKKKSKIGF